MTKKLSIAFSEEQAELLDVATRFCADKAPMDVVRKRLDAGHPHDADLWAEIVGLGWTAIAIPEEFGGVGLGLKEVVAVVEPMGRHLMGTPLYATTLTSQAILAGGTDAQKADLLPKIAEGSIVTLALSEANGDWDLSSVDAAATTDGDQIKLSGKKLQVQDAEVADTIIASVKLDGDVALVAIDKASIPDGALRREGAIDETRLSYSLTLDGITVPADAVLDRSKTADALDRIHFVGCLLLAAESAGGIAAVLNVVVEYLTTRKQFDKLIGSYQALKHPTVQILLDLESARSHLYYAAGIVEDDELDAAERAVAVRMAKTTADDGLAFAADRGIQFHGGFGFTYDCDAGLFRRRSLWSQHQFGDSRALRAKIADDLFGEVAA